MMHPLAVTPWYAALLALFYLGLSASVIRGRGRHGVDLGAGGVSDLERRIRVHGNFAEYAPFCLLVIGMDEIRGLSGLAVHGLCLCLLTGRLAHAWGVSKEDHDFRFRIVGMALTLTSLGLAAIAVPFTG